MTIETKIVGQTIQRKALQAGFALGVCAVLSVSSAFAQTPSHQKDENAPVAATVAPVQNTEQGLPQNLQPEQLPGPKGQTVNPKTVRRIQPVRQNRWNPAALTQTTGLSASSFTAPISPSGQDGQASLSSSMAADILTTEALLGEVPISVQPISQDISAPKEGASLINLSSSLRGALFDLPTNDNVNASVFQLDLGERLCLGTAEDCRSNEISNIDVGYAAKITHGKMNGFNLQLTPHAGVRFDDEEKSALVGALVRIGDNLREGSEMKSNTWYIFAGADAEAVTYTPNSARRLTSGEFHLQNRIIVGDAQAGVGYRIGTADLALTYFKRQAKAENYSYDEDAAALSITWKR